MNQQDSTLSDYYFRWLRSQGTELAGNLTVGSVCGKGRGLYWCPGEQTTTASSDSAAISMHEQGVATLPRSLVITAEHVRQTAASRWPVLAAWLDALAAANREEEEGDDDDTRSTLLALIIHHSRVLTRCSPRYPSLDDACPLLPYVAILPDDAVQASPVLWHSELDSIATTDATAADPVALLDGTSLGAAIRARRRVLHAEAEKWRAMTSLVRQSMQAAQISNSDDASYLLEDVAFEELARADALYWSRVLEIVPFADDVDDGRGTTAFLPLIDMCNHAGQAANARWQPTVEGDVVLYADSAHLARANEPIELCISYGDKPNEELLFLYGFTLADHQHDACTLMAPLEAGNAYSDEVAGADEHAMQVLVMGKMYLLQAAQWKPQLVLRHPSTHRSIDGNEGAAAAAAKQRWCPWLSADAERVLQLCVLGSDALSTVQDDDGELQWTVYGQALDNDKLSDSFDAAIAPHHAVLETRMAAVLYTLIHEQLARISPAAPSAPLHDGHQYNTSPASDRLRHIHHYLTGMERVGRDVLDWLAKLPGDHHHHAS
ncbi:hypothetical protein SYNPS1DRAFT_27855 [Syncephalis pseudoplumigaleata]|uniref:SET domain-containing protein n=1 Tax=Syncephalis pseudoplumigaleata TaxID=1712513 RepID=A0A4P9Z3S2_9FUNG|nr:hypothetical protein SYNPS1DRAFT_27855 [Syncephalis pseudoplumigaleata]|eukprot:RKP26451.1 hypothetical protein SYNPS1DRAFT_27855 [Syncephalis pseudoplumigaleata]